MLKKHKIIFSVVSLLACSGISSGAVAQSKSSMNSQDNMSSMSDRLKPFQVQPRFTLSGLSGDRTLAEGQTMVPLRGDNTSALYAVAEGSFIKKDNNWMAGAGLGYREIVNDMIVGGYVTADYWSTKHNRFTIFNPGFEILGWHGAWDLNVSGYIPLENGKKLGLEGWAEEDFDIYDYNRATGHNMYDHKLQEYEEARRGFDITIGRTVPGLDSARIYLGGYHFDTRNATKTMNGGEFRFKYDLNKYTALELIDDYDNINKNKVMIGVRFTLGGYDLTEQKQFGLASRLLDPIEHTHVHMVDKLLVDQGEFLKHDKAFFIKTGSSNSNDISGDGTAENPFIGFSPEIVSMIDQNKDIGVIDKNPVMYFSAGDYDLTAFKVNHGTGDITGRFAVPNGWSMYGRTNDYKAPGKDDNRAKFLGGLDFNYVDGEGLDTSVLNSIQVVNANKLGLDNATLYLNNASGVDLRNVYVGNSIASIGSSNQRLIGIYAKSSTLNFVSGDNVIDVTTRNIASTGSTYVDGVFSDSSVINFQQGYNIIDVILLSTSSTSVSYAINENNNSVVNFNGGKNLFEAISPNGTTNRTFYVKDSVLNFNSGSNYLNAISIGGASSYAIYADPNANINFNGGNNFITAKSVGGAWGLGTNNTSGNVNINGGNNNFDVQTVTGNAYGINIIGVSSSNVFNLFINGGINNFYTFVCSNSSASVTSVSVPIATGNYGNTIISGGTNNIYAESLYGSTATGISTAVSVANATSNTTISGGTNNIVAKSMSGSAVGIGAYGPPLGTINNTLSTIEVTGGTNNIFAENMFGTSIGMQVSGLNGTSLGKINITNGINNIYSKSSLGKAYGSSTRLGSTNISGGTNNFYVQSDNDAVYGGYFDNSGSLNISSGVNSFYVKTIKGDAFGLSTGTGGYGIMTMSGGTTNINVQSSDGNVYGFYNASSAANTYFNFVGDLPANTLNINVNALDKNKIQAGIYAVATTSGGIKINGTAVTAETVGDIANFTTFTRNVDGGNATGSGKVYWAKTPAIVLPWDVV